MSDSTERRPISPYRGRSLDREELTDLIETVGSTGSPASPRGLLWSVPCGHVFCRSDEWGVLYPGTAEWESDGGCSLEDRRVSASSPARVFPRGVGVGDVDGLNVRVRAVSRLRRARFVPRTIGVAVWVPAVVGLVVAAWLSK